METEPSPAQPAQPAATNQQFSFQLPEQPGLASNNNVNTETIQNINNLSLTGQSNSTTELQITNLEPSGGRSLANIPPSERPKAKPSRKIDGKGAKKSQLQAALQQHSQQLAQLQQLQQLNQQLQHQVECLVGIVRPALLISFPLRSSNSDN